MRHSTLLQLLLVIAVVLLGSALSTRTAKAATTIMVTTTNDELNLVTNSLCSLREAVRLADGLATDSACGANDEPDVKPDIREKRHRLPPQSFR